MNLFEEGETNAERVRAAYSAIEYRPEVTAFAETIAPEARVTMNRRGPTVVKILRGNEILNSGEAARRAGLGRVDLMRDKHAPMLERRLAFDAMFDGSDSFFYGALNLGTIGTPGRKDAFGRYCIVLTTELFASTFCNAVCIKRDSLHDSYFEASILQTERLTADTAPYRSRAMLAANKLEAKLTGASPAAWARLLIAKERGGRDDYIEIIFTTTRSVTRADLSLRIESAASPTATFLKHEPEAPTGSVSVPDKDLKDIVALCTRYGVAVEWVI